MTLIVTYLQSSAAEGCAGCASRCETEKSPGTEGCQNWYWAERAIKVGDRLRHQPETAEAALRAEKRAAAAAKHEVVSGWPVRL